MLLTRAPVAGRRRPKPSPPLPPDLHVLSLPLAFILSQDQTLRCYLYISFDILLFLLRLSYIPNNNYLILGISPKAYLFVRSWPYLFSFLRIDGKLFFCFPCLCCSDGFTHPCPVASFHCPLAALSRSFHPPRDRDSGCKITALSPSCQILQPQLAESLQNSTLRP